MPAFRVWPFARAPKRQSAQDDSNQDLEDASSASHQSPARPARSRPRFKNPITHRPGWGHSPAPSGPIGSITPYEPHTDFVSVLKLWHLVLPSYAIPEPRLRDLLDRDHSAHFVIRASEHNRKPLAVGFVATYEDRNRPTSYVAALIVHPHYQHRGIGSRLLNHAVEHLRTATGKLRITIGSRSPRLLSGVPLDIPSQGYDFFVKRGFTPDKGPTARDYVISLDGYHAPLTITDRARRARIAYHPLTPEEAEECLAIQHQFFGKDTVWTGAYESLIKENQHRQIMVAVDIRTSKQIGWALMIEPAAGGLINDFALPPLVGDKTGLIACVGVHPDARKRGVGLGLVAAAAEDMKKRSLKYAFIDGVGLADWYEKVDAKVWREYRTLSSNSYLTHDIEMAATGN